MARSRLEQLVGELSTPYPVDEWRKDQIKRLVADLMNSLGRLEEDYLVYNPRKRYWHCKRCDSDGWEDRDSVEHRPACPFFVEKEQGREHPGN